jgi:hypothetical protein
MKTYWRVEVYLHAFLTLNGLDVKILDVSEWILSVQCIWRESDDYLHLKFSILVAEIERMEGMQLHPGLAHPGKNDEQRGNETK